VVREWGILTYAGLASAHYEIWMMLRHVGRSGGGAIVICQPIVGIWTPASASLWHSRVSTTNVRVGDNIVHIAYCSVVRRRRVSDYADSCTVVEGSDSMAFVCATPQDS